MKQQLAQVLRTGVRTARASIDTLDPPSGNHSNPAFAYAEINRTLASFLADDPEVPRPNYTWGVLHAAHLAQALRVPRISVIEFGVAGGNGLVALELAAEKTEGLYGVTIDVHGFDTGCGLPKPPDYRDHPNNYEESTYVMDQEKLRARLTRASLHLGLVADTVRQFLDGHPAPVGFVSFDLDYYQSTVDAFALLKANPSQMLPRVHCYFDDIMGLTCAEFAGERLAINEFNDANRERKISPIFGLKYFLLPHHAQQQWAEMMYLAHIIDHPQYGDRDGLVVSAERPLIG